jgi:hypothetical protein
MVKADEYKGIEYVRISNLPQDEADQIKGSSIIKKITILKDETLMRDCITYNAYKSWYENHYHPSGAGNSPLAPEKLNGKTHKKNHSFNLMRHFNSFLQKI